jgi:Ni,Fe-hydrogenase III large subunit
MTKGDALAVGHIAAKRQADADGYARVSIGPNEWRALAQGCADGLQELSAIWFDNGRIRAALIDSPRRTRSIVSLQSDNGSYPAFSYYHAPALRLERAMRDLYATQPTDLPDSRPWLDHGVWPHRSAESAAADYMFLSAYGTGLHQIPVGPVHAGIIEPGHFRFTANGETVVRLEERLGYVHKGIESLCAGADIGHAARIAGRISGDSTVAYAFAFARATEAALKWQVPERAHLLRGIMAEIERLSHHVNDVGAICNDASVVAVHARAMLIREDILQTAAKCFGHRLMMDRIIPGGVAANVDEHKISEFRDLLERIETSLRMIVHVYDEMPSLQDRTVGTGTVKPELVRQFAAGGYVGRAAGRVFDARAAFPYPPYDRVNFSVPTRSNSDVDARIWIRIDEIYQSCSIIRQLLDQLKPGPVQTKRPRARSAEGAALVEAFRGDVFVAVRLGDRHEVLHLHARDASWFQWPLLEAAIEGNIVADFPLCNKSFNCSYSGHDL